MLPSVGVPSVVTRSTLPLRTLPAAGFRFCGLVPRVASPVVTNSVLNWSNRVRQPECTPLADRSMPVTIGVPPSVERLSGATTKRTTRMSLAVM